MAAAGGGGGGDGAGAGRRPLEHHVGGGLVQRVLRVLARGLGWVGLSITLRWVQGEY